MIDLTLADPAFLGAASPAINPNGPPPPIPDPLALWFEGDLELDHEDPVAAWVDRINGRTLAATGAARPTYLADGINGRPAIDFDGANHILTLGTSALDTTATEGCVIAIAANDAPNAVHAMWAHSQFNASDRYLYGANHTGGRVRMDAATSVGSRAAHGSTPLGTDPHLIEWERSSSGWAMRVDGELQTITNLTGSHAVAPWFASVATANRWAVGGIAFNNATIPDYNGRIAVIGAAASPLSNETRAALLGWAVARYTLSTPLTGSGAG